MNIFYRFAILFGMVFPKNIAGKYSKAGGYAGVEQEDKVYLGLVGLLSLIFSCVIIAGLYAFYLIEWWGYLLAVLGFFVAAYLQYLVLIFKIDSRQKETEGILPDFLQLVSSNMKAGMTPYKAVKLAAQIDFGVLSKEINRIIKKSSGVDDFGVLMLSLNERIQSKLLDRSLQLLVTSLRAGGNSAQLLEDLAGDLTESMSLKRELLAQTKTYTLFIIFTVLIGTPLLLAISANFMERVSGLSFFQQEEVGFELAGLAVNELPITPELLFKTSIVVLFFICLFASMFLGVLRDGKRSAGLKFTIPLYGIALAIYFAIGFLINALL